MTKDVLKEAEIDAMEMTELVNAVTVQRNAQMEKMMEMFSKSLKAISNNKQPGKETMSANQECPHYKIHQRNHNDCWELEKNASKHALGWKPIAEHKKKKGVMSQS